MRDVDAEAPVVWPAWCYSGSAGATDQGPGAGVASALVRRAARPRVTSDHPLNNNTLPSVKSERLSPNSNINDRSSSRSRSVTPSSCSFPGTPPQGAERGPSPGGPGQLASGAAGGPPQMLGSAGLPGQQHMQGRPHALARNYSDFMRSLAAKYNNVNPNDFFTGRPPPNGAPAPPLPPPLKAAPLGDLLLPGGAPPSPRPLRGLFASYPAAHGAPRQLTAFPTVMDMSSTKALLAIARVANAAKEAEIANNFSKESSKRPRGPSLGETHPLSSPLDLSSARLFNPKRSRMSPKNQEINENASSSSNEAGDRSPGVENLVKIEMRNGNLKIDESNRSGAGSPSSCGVKSPGSSGRKSPGSSGRKSPGSASGKSPGWCCRERRDRPATPDPEVAAWSVDEVCSFVESIDICAEYAPMFREQQIDGSGLPLLTEDHLTGRLGLKLGPALKLRALLAARAPSRRPCRCERALGASSHTPVKAEPRPASAQSDDS